MLGDATGNPVCRQRHRIGPEQASQLSLLGNEAIFLGCGRAAPSETAKRNEEGFRQRIVDPGGQQRQVGGIQAATTLDERLHPQEEETD